MKAKKYKIVAFYTTGDSYNSDNTDTDVLEHNDLDVANDNMLRIKAHYEYYDLMHNTYRSANAKLEEATKNAMQQPWFVNVPKTFHKKSRCAVVSIPKGKEDDYVVAPDPYHAEHCLILKTDEGEDFQLSAPWCGYFESLNALEIVPNEKFMRIEF